MEKDEMLISDEFGKMLKSLRKKRGLTLADLSDLSGISISYLNRLEKGERKSPGFTKILKLAKVLKVDPASLVGSDLNMSDKPMSISELLFSTQIEHNDEILTASQKELLVEIIETVLLVKFEGTGVINDLQQIAELISELKELQ
ncbi:helix-turn-helix domain-containing protein [Solibacillus merdavium]|uniref:Helix-turn-helix domain-containing protein n=1 Tax=Solibacillus merdavium TaxID=2762218 RepID=A0ABR8XRM1_9BACL|nr:helix-turn-helix transcriptional regulator [Solibacillus merdavium]MBD8034596.1 helix-turn-helix domain-containing protein [Solibacillus merdavium]